MDISFRMAERADCPVILSFIKELAVYEKRADQVTASVRELAEWLFDKRVAEVMFASLNGREVGFALFFPHYSTFLGLPGLYLEDIYVLEEYRGRGVGTAMMRELARTAVGRGYGRFEWSCLDWNTPSVEFYLKLGAVPLDEWTTFRLSGDTLFKIAAMKNPGV